MMIKTKNNYIQLKNYSPKPSTLEAVKLLFVDKDTNTFRTINILDVLIANKLFSKDFMEPLYEPIQDGLIDVSNTKNSFEEYVVSLSLTKSGRKTFFILIL